MGSRKIGVLLSYVMMVFEVLSTLLLTPYIIRTLGQAEYGVYKLSASVVAYLLLLDLGVGNAVIRFTSKYRATGDVEQGQKFAGVSIIYYSAIAVITIICGVFLIHIYPTIFANGLSSDEVALGQRLLRITVCNAAVTLATAVYANIIIAYEYFAVSRICSIVQILLKILMTVIVLKLSMGSVGIVTVNLITTILCRGIFVAFVFLKIKIKPIFHGIQMSFIKEIIIYSSLILLQMVATQINACADQILLGMLVSSSSVIIAVYSVGTQIVQYFQSIGSAFNNILMPGVVKMVEGNVGSDRLCDEMIRIGRIIFMVLVLIWGCFLVFGNQFVVLWAGNKNTQAYYVAIILMTAYTLILPQSIGSQILWAMNEHKEQAILKIIIVILNIILTGLLIKWNPLIGATIGTFISLALGDIGVMNIIFKHKIGINLAKYYTELLKGILPCIIVASIFGALFKLIGLSGWIGLIVNIGVMCIIYFAEMWFWGMKQSEKRIIYSVMSKIGIKSKNI